MDIQFNSNSFFVFDLDDTLYQEIDFLRSAYRYIAGALEPAIGSPIYDEMLSRYQRRENVFGWIIDHYRERLGSYDLEWLLSNYREHVPEIELGRETRGFINEVRSHQIPMGLITDGRSITQRNKLKALGIENFFSSIVISEEFGSEKPDEKNYLHFETSFPGAEFYYFGDNTRKDFITPARLGWQTICLKDRGENIHKQVFDGGLVPGHVISGFEEVRLKKY